MTVLNPILGLGGLEANAFEDSALEALRSRRRSASVHTEVVQEEAVPSRADDRQPPKLTPGLTRVYTAQVVPGATFPFAACACVNKSG
jgi:hypothetical protein